MRRNFATDEAPRAAAAVRPSRVHCSRLKQVKSLNIVRDSFVQMKLVRMKMVLDEGLLMMKILQSDFSYPPPPLVRQTAWCEYKYGANGATEDSL